MPIGLWRLIPVDPLPWSGDPLPEPLPPSAWRARPEDPTNRARPEEAPRLNVLAMLGGEAFFDRVWDRRPAVMELPAPARDWVADAAALAPMLAARGQVEVLDADGRRPLRPDEIGDLGGSLDDRLLVLRDVHAHLPAVASLRDAFAAFFGCPVTTGLYLNGGVAPGFPEHADGHHVFAVQLDGAKRWRIGPPRHPGTMRRFAEPARSTDRLNAEVEVAAGAVLYLPLGWRHRAEPAHGRSIHLTLGVHVPRLLDAVEAAVEEAARLDAGLRAPLAMEVGQRGLRWIAPAAQVRAAVARLARVPLPARPLHDGTAVHPGPVGPMPALQGAWPVHDGVLAPHGLDTVPPELQALVPLAETLTTEAAVAAVYLRGSALASDPHAFDVDLALVVHDPPDAAAQHRIRTWLAEAEAGLGVPIDVALAPLAALRDGSSHPWLRACLAVAAVRLAGEPVWNTPPPIPANADLAQALWIESATRWRTVLGQVLGRGPGADARQTPPEAVAWIQKRALRLGGFLALEASGVFTRHPLGCATAIAHLRPDLAGLATRVARDLIAAEPSDDAAGRALALGGALLA